MPETPFYIRTAEGDVFNVETLEEALTQFVSDNGYRLTLRTQDHEVVIRRGGEAGPGLIPSESTYMASITVRSRTTLATGEQSRNLEIEDLPCEHGNNRDQCKECEVYEL